MIDPDFKPPWDVEDPEISDTLAEADLDDLLKKVDEVREPAPAPKPRERTGPTPSPDQQAAIDAVLALKEDGGFQAKVTGAAGTGKTTFIRMLMDALIDSDPDLTEYSGIMLMAYTGVAARRMAFATGHVATTIHKQLYFPIQTEEQEEIETKIAAEAERYEDAILENKGPAALTEISDRIAELRAELDELRFGEGPSKDLVNAKVVIIDESSMISPKIAEDLANATSAFQIYVGDPNQLPPVKDDFWFDQMETTASLTQVHRQAEGSAILDLAAHILRGGNVREIPESNEITFRAGIPPTKQLVAEGGQIIVGFNKTRTKIIRDTRRICRLDQSEHSWMPQNNERLVVTRNHNRTGLANGDQVIVRNAHMKWANAGGRKRRVVSADIFDPIDGRTIALGIELNCEDLYSHYEQDGAVRPPLGGLRVDFAYAITAHKAQGNEYDVVSVIWEPFEPKDQKMPGLSMKTRWAYVACTRAKRRLRIFFR